VLALGAGPSGRSLGPSKLALAEDLAGRAGIAIDNALLVRDIQEADHRKDEFLAMLGHELRNPLAPICNAVQLLRGLGPPDPQRDELRDVIDRQLNKLTRLVDDLLDVSRITTGKIRLQIQVLDAADAARSAVETSRPVIEARRHTLEVALPDAPIRLNGDIARLSQVLSNLLNNAAKYTEVGGRIWLSLEREGNDAVFRVRDTGSGIAPDVLPRVFDLFTQADQSLDRAQGGLGIGLTLVRRLIETHGGNVQAFSAGLGQGSEFIVRLPAIQAETAKAVTPEAGSAAHCHTFRCRVLVVDDNADTAETLAMLMRHDGHEVLTANDGVSALEATDSFRPEVVLLDIGLPRMDGYEVARRLRAKDCGADLFLAAITGYDQAEDHVRSQQAGFDHHLVKPVRLAALRQLLASHRAAARS
jgi:CheY-like chemotaxis protein